MTESKPYPTLHSINATLWLLFGVVFEFYLPEDHIGKYIIMAAVLAKVLIFFYWLSDQKWSLKSFLKW